ncbi:SDR family oxidoreductase [Sphingosinicella sp. YJ22]|uniref:SDR family oxidoreductase n=1 Tax=Sphingosinicella sp. YJ22 TaxID=1104780 RepID=UPI0014092BE9|nr:SDR family oxidoreductase [Sphingosinicella sp. YJ22]
MPTLLITGANRGLGLEFARQYAADGWTVIATVRNPDRADDLRRVPGEIRVEQLDVADVDAIRAFAATVGEPVDHLICNAGVMGKYSEVDPDSWVYTLRVNVIAPTVLALALVDRIAPGGKVVAITSKMGSIADNESGGGIIYRSSKAALNAAWRSLAIDWRGRDLAVAMLHPGWVQTDMGGAQAPTPSEESIAGLRRVIAGLTREQSGSFLDYQGNEIPW